MSTPYAAPGARLLERWQRLVRLPGGRWIFHRLLARTVPYTGALGARVTHLAPGECDVQLRDRRGVRNHLDSVHAIALANLAELASGTATLTALPPGVRGIVTRLEIDYARKARGTITARARVVVPTLEGPSELHPEAELTDESGARVAHARVTWRVAPFAPGAAAAATSSA